jgi:acetylornithine deacetylase/succinyl-diaminopimelate desuccinylase-like protein
VWAGSVPADVTIKIQIGFSPPLTCTQVFDEIKELVKRKIKNAYISKGKLCRENFRNNSSCPLLESLKKIIRENCKTDPSCRIVSGHSDMGFYKCNNVIMYGPGAGWNAHGMNESYKLSDMPIVVNNLLELITGVNKRIK